MNDIPPVTVSSTTVDYLVTLGVAVEMLNRFLMVNRDVEVRISDGVITVCRPYSPEEYEVIGVFGTESLELKPDDWSRAAFSIANRRWP